MLYIEKRATLSLATLFSLRMLGLFIVLPVFTPYAKTLSDATPFLMGLALGIYGLTQAAFQLPLGALSDYYPRKNIIALGFFIFILGSVVAAISDNIFMLMVGRALQGSGAVGSTIMALLSDFTRAEKRSKSMAIVGMIIGMTFFMSLLIGPFLNHFIGVHGIFWLSALLGLIAILLNYYWVPIPKHTHLDESTKNFTKNLKSLLREPELLKLDLGIFLLHAVLTATFVIMPLYVHKPWVYAPALILSVLFTFKFMKCIRAAVAGLVLSLLCLWQFHENIYLLMTGLCLFFTGFNILEANLPSLVSQTAPSRLKGTAIGVYSTCQYLGIFAGGIVGGLLLQSSFIIS
ncbi:MAG: MFS transporter [Gammaproteobacteria bacterium]|nr:MFS transporter [Gammaproteobacteria bacterium]